MGGLKGCDEEVDTVTTFAIDAVTFAHSKSTENSVSPNSLGEKTNDRIGNSQLQWKKSNYENRFHLVLKMKVQASMRNTVLRSQTSPTKRMWAWIWVTQCTLP